MDPNNPIYKQLYREYSYAGQAQYETTVAREYHSPLSFVGKIFLGLMAVRFVMYLLQMLYYGLLLGY